jgi:CheY-like chemotaxis protein
VNNGSILVVDDNPNNVSLLAEILRGAGYQVRVALSGAKALSMMATQPPDLVMLDINMPELDGYEVCRRLKAGEATRAVPVIFISALDDVLDKVAAFDAGGVDYVTKPFEAAEVLARARSQLELSRLRLELERSNADLRRRNEDLLRAMRRTEQAFLTLSEVLPGTVLDGTYRLDKKIGEGGFGAVFRAQHLGLRRAVAVKVLRPSESHQLARFKLEGIAACRVGHPNAVEVMHFGFSAEGIAYLVMELLNGRNLADVLHDRGKLPPAYCLSILATVCAVLQEAHGHGILHRDIKPANIFLHQTEQGEQVVKVLDFGIAKLLDDDVTGEFNELTHTGIYVGTPEYMAPERFLEDVYDGSADVYSVGVMAYRMLSGERPIVPRPGGAIVGGLSYALTAPRPLRDANPKLSKELERVVMSALAKEPTERPGPQEFALALAAAIEKA